MRPARWLAGLRRADISDPQELVARAQTLSAELATPIAPGFEALVFKAGRRIEDAYELTYIRKDRSRLPAEVSVMALQDATDANIRYVLIGADNTARQRAEAQRKHLNDERQLSPSSWKRPAGTAAGRNPTNRGGRSGKRHLLVDDRGVPLSLVVTGANAHDVMRRDQVLQAILVNRQSPSTRRGEYLGVDPGYRGRRVMEIIESQGCIAHVVGRNTEADAKRRNPATQARRWAVEVCQSWFGRFRKLLVRYEKLERSFVALNHIGTAIIEFPKVKLAVELVYG